MKDLSCLLAGLTRLLGPAALAVLWRKKTGARLFPAVVALLVCFPVFIFGAVVRSGFDRSDLISFYLQQGLLYGVLEEGAKFVSLRYLIPSYNSRKDAVSYGIGASAYEELGAAIACFGLIGTGRAAPAIFPVAVFSVADGAVSSAALTVIILYGIREGVSRITLPAAILFHAVSNATSAAFGFSDVIIFTKSLLLTAIVCFAAYRLWKDMAPPEDIME